MIFQALYNMLITINQEKERWILILTRIGLTRNEAENLFALCEKHRKYSQARIESFNRIIQWAYSDNIEPYDLRCVMCDYPLLLTDDSVVNFNDFLIKTGVRVLINE